MNQNDNSIYINRLKSWLYHQKRKDPQYDKRINFYISKYEDMYFKKKQKEINKKIKERNDFIKYP